MSLLEIMISLSNANVDLKTTDYSSTAKIHFKFPLKDNRDVMEKVSCVLDYLIDEGFINEENLTKYMMFDYTGHKIII